MAFVILFMTVAASGGALQAMANTPPVVGLMVDETTSRTVKNTAAQRQAKLRYASFLRKRIVLNRQATCYWRQVALQACSARRVNRRIIGLDYLKWSFHLSSRQQKTAWRFALNPPHKAQWLCIHSYEGSWRDSGDPYWGGLQMDRGFMGSYATKRLLNRGYADRWSPLEQMWVAERAYNSGRGFHPWPNTAHFCGLI